MKVSRSKKECMYCTCINVLQKDPVHNSHREIFRLANLFHFKCCFICMTHSAKSFANSNSNAKGVCVGKINSRNFKDILLCRISAPRLILTQKMCSLNSLTLQVAKLICLLKYFLNCCFFHPPIPVVLTQRIISQFFYTTLQSCRKMSLKSS